MFHACQNYYNRKQITLITACQQTEAMYNITGRQCLFEAKEKWKERRFCFKEISVFIYFCLLYSSFHFCFFLLHIPYYQNSAASKAKQALSHVLNTYRITKIVAAVKRRKHLRYAQNKNRITKIVPPKNVQQHSILS